MTNYQSRFQIGDPVIYEKGATAYGTIVAVTFTKSKVFYDILDDLNADVIRKVDSVFVTGEKSAMV